MTMQAERQKKMVMSIDPGKTIGWSIGRGDTLADFGEDDKISFMMRLSRYLYTHEPKVGRFVIERFDIRSYTDDAADTVKLIGAIEWVIESSCLKVPAEVNPDAKKRFKNHPNVLALRTSGRGHAADAEALRLWDLHYGTW